MAKPRGLDAKLNRLRSLRHERAEEAIGELRKSLGDSSNLVVAEAAEIIGTRLFAELAADVAGAFARFMIEPEKSDKRCRAKIAIVEALNKLDYPEEEVFLQGIQHVQMEPVWGGHEDTAAQLRGSSAYALVRLDYSDVLNLLAELLVDRDKVARVAAAHALGATGKLAAVPLLRFKARIGDADPTVTGECLTALMRLAPTESLPFVTRFLYAADASLQEGAALALAESRRPESLEVLQDFWRKTQGGSIQEVVLLAISMLRLPAALDFLLEIVGGENQSAALAALSALTIHRHNEPFKERVAAIVAQKRSAALKTRFEAKFNAAK